MSLQNQTAARLFQTWRKQECHKRPGELLDQSLQGQLHVGGELGGRLDVRRKGVRRVGVARQTAEVVLAGQNKNELKNPNYQNPALYFLSGPFNFKSCLPCVICLLA